MTDSAQPSGHDGVGMRHAFDVAVTWGGPGAAPTTEVRRFPRRASASAGAGVPPLPVSAARPFFGDRASWNPETLLLAALAQCHLLAFLRTAGLAGHEVVAATVDVSGELVLEPDGVGRFVAATLTPRTTFARPATAEALAALHQEAHRQCFIANSLAFPVTLAPDIAS